MSFFLYIGIALDIKKSHILLIFLPLLFYLFFLPKLGTGHIRFSQGLVMLATKLKKSA